MKSLNTFLILLTAISFTSCSSDDDAAVNPNAAFAGQYNLSILAAPLEVDYNLDGTASTNLMLESPCFSDSHIVLNEDMTFTAVNGYVYFISEDGCQTEESSGTWEVNGNILILSDDTMHEDLILTTEYTIDGNTLNRTAEDAPYPDRDEENNPVYSTGILYYTYTKV